MPQLLLLAGATFLTVVAVGVFGSSLFRALPTKALTAQAQALAAMRYYPTCQAAHAVSVYSIPRGEPGYRVPLDRDLDGLACEPHLGR